MYKESKLLDVWFWQLIISPHMAGLIVALAKSGVNVRCIASQAMSSDRISQGWVPPALPGVEIIWIDSKETVKSLINTAPANSVHICQGIRANGLISFAQKLLSEQKFKQFSIMETVEDSGWRGFARRIIYSYLFKKKNSSLEGVLCIGDGMARWVKARGIPSDKVYPFTYFLPDQALSVNSKNLCEKTGIFRFIYVGRLIYLKRVDMLISALSHIVNKSFELWIVGGGPEEESLKRLADEQLKAHIKWFGQMPMEEIPRLILQADCLVLPSIHDGWGAVCSEALMVGTPVICSDACGAAGVVRESNVGGVFSSKNQDDLQRLLTDSLSAGCVKDSSRAHTRKWAQALGANAGACYLIKILSGIKHLSPPWTRGKEAPRQTYGDL